MSSPTTEGFTKNPIYPTSALVDYGTTTFTNSTANWNNDTGGRDLPPTIETQCCNSFPEKITVGSGGGVDYLILQPGVWEFTVQYVLKASAVSVPPEVGIGFWDEDQTDLYSFDTKNDANIPMGSAYCGSKTGTFAIDQARNVRFTLLQRKGGESLTAGLIKVLYTRVSDYTAS